MPTINGLTSGTAAVADETEIDQSGIPRLSRKTTLGAIIDLYNSRIATMTDKTLTTPTIGDFSNAAHDHLDAAGGGNITEAAISDLGNLVALVADTLAVFAATTSAELAGVISDESGSGLLVFNNSPTFITPALGTPASGVGTNLTGIPITGLNSFSSLELLTQLSDESGSGLAVFNNSPTFITPALGTPASGVATNIIGLPVTGLANGTDGELITWSTAGVAETVAVGTNDQVLTSNGAGAVPTFQAAPLSVAGVQTSVNIDNRDGQFMSAFAVVSISTVESIVSVPVEAGTLRRHVVQITTNTGSNNLTIISRIAGASGNNTVTVTGGNTGIFSDATTDAISQDGLIDYIISHATEGANITIRGYSTAFDWR